MKAIMGKLMMVNGMKKFIMAAMAATALAANAGTTGTWGTNYAELNYAFMGSVDGSPTDYFSDNGENLRTDGTIKVFEEAHFFLSTTPPSFYGENGKWTTFMDFYEEDPEFFTDFMMNIWDHETWVAQERVVWEDNWDYTAKWELPSTIDMGEVYDAFVIVILKLSDIFMEETGLGEYIWIGAEATGVGGNMSLNFKARTFWGNDEGLRYDSFDFSYLFPVPEPATGLLALAGIALLVRRKRK